MLKGSVRYEFDHLERKIKEQLRTPSFYEKLYHAVDGLSSLFFAIARTNGMGWAAQVKDAQGQPRLTVEEQGQYTKIFEPYIPAILRFMKGGEAVQSGGSQPHDVIDSVLQSVDGIEQGYKSMLSKVPFSLYQLQKDGDPKEDIHLIPEVLRGAIAGLGPTGKTASIILEKIKLPLRSIIFIIHVLLDTSRVTMAALGQEEQRKMLTIVLAIYEFLLGDWKKCILTIIGYVGTSAQFMGQYGKLFFIFYDMYDQQAKRSAIHGVVDGARTFLVGVLAHLFQLTAPKSIRDMILPIFTKISANKSKIDAILKEKGFEPLPADYDPTYDNPITFLVMISGSKLFHCSCEQQEIVDTLMKTESSILSTIMILLGLPVDKPDRIRMCGAGQCNQLIDLLPTSNVTPDTTQGDTTSAASGGDEFVPVEKSVKGESQKASQNAAAVPYVHIASQEKDQKQQPDVAVPSVSSQVPGHVGGKHRTPRRTLTSSLRE